MTLKRFFSLFIVCVFAVHTASAQKAESAYRMKTVVIDAGHGGNDPGNLGTGRYKLKEKDIALDVAKRVGRFINEIFPEIKVIYTRETDVFIGLNERADVANRADADLFLSIHCNAAKNPEAYGVETFALGLHRNDENLQVAMKENQAIFLEDDYQTKYQGFDPNSPESIIALTIMQSAFLEQSLRISSYIQHQFKDKIGRKDRGVKQAGFLVLRRTTMPSILIELGFLTNKGEEDFLNSENGRLIMASAIFQGFREYKERVEGGASTTKAEAPKPQPEIAKETKPEPAKEAKPEPIKETKPEPLKEAKPEPTKEVKPQPAKETKPQPEVAKETKPAPEKPKPTPAVDPAEAEKAEKKKQLEEAKAEMERLQKLKLEQDLAAQKKAREEQKRKDEADRLAMEKAAMEKELTAAKLSAEQKEQAEKTERIQREAVAEQARVEFAERLAEREKAKQDSVKQVHLAQREKLASEPEKTTTTVKQIEEKREVVPQLADKPLTEDEAELLFLEKRRMELEARIAKVNKGKTEGAQPELNNTPKQVESKPQPPKAEVKTPAPVIATPTSPVENGVILSIQITTSPTPLDLNSPRFKGEKARAYVQDGLHKYVVGSFTSFAVASKEQTRLRNLGFEGAFLVAFKDGERIKVDEARAILK